MAREIDNCPPNYRGMVSETVKENGDIEINPVKASGPWFLPGAIDVPGKERKDNPKENSSNEQE